MQLAFSPQSQRDLRAIGDYIAIDNPIRAANFVAELRKSCASLETESTRYPVLDRPTGYRRMPVGNYLVSYRVSAEVVHIVRVVHSARDLLGLGLN